MSDFEQQPESSLLNKFWDSTCEQTVVIHGQIRIRQWLLGYMHWKQVVMQYVQHSNCQNVSTAACMYMCTTDVDQQLDLKAALNTNNTSNEHVGRT